MNAWSTVALLRGPLRWPSALVGAVPYGALFHDGADALARLAARFVDHDKEMTSADYRERACGIAEVFSIAFRRQSV